MEKLKIYRQKNESKSLKPANIHADTHEKLQAVSVESGVSMVKLLSLCVDFALENMEIVEADDKDRK